MKTTRNISRRVIAVITLLLVTGILNTQIYAGAAGGVSGTDAVLTDNQSPALTEPFVPEAKFEPDPIFNTGDIYELLLNDFLSDIENDESFDNPDAAADVTSSADAGEAYSKEEKPSSPATDTAETDTAETVSGTDRPKAEETEEEAVPFCQSAVSDGVRITVSAPEGVFPTDSYLYVANVPSDAQAAINRSLAGRRGSGTHVVSSYRFDIKVLDADGNELQPADGSKVTVSFTAAEIADPNLSTEVYHFRNRGSSVSACKLAAASSGNTTTVVTDGFSYYTVEFTYSSLQYVLWGGSSVPLSDILSFVGLSGEVSKAKSSDKKLFTVSKKNGEWIVSSRKPFTSEEWLKVTIDGVEYEIIVTDAIITSAEGTHTFIFHSGGAEYKTVILGEGETLSEPEPPTAENGRFVGWYEDAACTVPFDGFGQTATPDDSITEVYAKFSDTAYLTYYNTNGQVVLVEEVNKGDTYTFDSAYPAFATGSSSKVNKGWINQNGNKYGTNDSVTVTGDLELTPEIDEGHYVRFDTQGGSVVPSQFVTDGGTASAPSDDPTHNGYNFEGWYDAADGGNPFDFSTPITADDVTVYAHWSQGPANFTLVFMGQNADDDNYTYFGSYDKTGVTGQSTADFWDNSDAEFAKARINTDAQFYIKEDAQHNLIIEHKTIEADGSTVVYVYCDRIYYYIRYNNKNYPIRQTEHIPSWIQKNGLDDMYQYIAWDLHDLVVGRYVYNIYYNNKLITALYLNDMAFHNAYVLNNAARNRGGVPAGQELPIGAVLTLSNFRNIEGQYHYPTDVYYETIDSTPDNKKYGDPVRLTPKLTQSTNTYTDKSDERFTLARVEGYSRKTSDGGYEYATIAGSTTRKLMSVYYDRNKYNISFFTNGGPDVPSVNNIFYEAPVMQYSPAGYTVGTTVKAQEGINYMFTGWYTDSACFNPFDFNTATMPPANLSLYAGWEPIHVTVTYDANGGTLTDHDTVPLLSGQLAQKPTDPVRSTGSQGNDWEFIGWVLPDGTLYDFSKPVTHDIMLTAKWESVNVNYSVTYDAGEGSGTPPSDTNKYTTNSTAKAAEPGALVPPSGKHFVYWADSTDPTKIYYPGDVVPVGESNVELIAVYQPDDHTTSLVYDFNYSSYGIPVPEGVVQRNTGEVADVLNNTVLSLRPPAGTEIPPYCTFGGWYRDAACTGSDLSGTQIRINTKAEIPNVVYAKWIMQTAALTISKTVEGSGAETDKGFNFTVSFDRTGSFNCVLPDGTSKDISSGGVITLKHGEKATLEIPVGAKYTVSEASYKDYKVTDKNAYGTMPQNGVEASFVNKKIPASGSTPKTGDDTKANNLVSGMILFFVSLLYVAYTAYTDKRFRAKLLAVPAGISAFLSGYSDNSDNTAFSSTNAQALDASKADTTENVASKIAVLNDDISYDILSYDSFGYDIGPEPEDSFKENYDTDSLDFEDCLDSESYDSLDDFDDLELKLNELEARLTELEDDFIL